MSTSGRWRLGLPGWWWWGVVPVASILAVGLWWLPAPHWYLVSRISPSMRPDDWLKVIALYLGGAVVGHLVTYQALRGFDRLTLLGRPTSDSSTGGGDLLDRPADSQQYQIDFPPVLVGLIESVLYPTALLVGKPEFIGVWLALKVAGQWKAWQEAQEGRRLFNRYLVGNGLSIIVAFATYTALRVLISWQPRVMT